ncbi:MAG TPA: glycosyltransferase, partial [Conexibacter sp.]|nr:glycosyltransferase [Conexibacter sp.]
IAAARDGVVVLTDGAAWEPFDDARVVIVAELTPAGSVFDAIASARARAAERGRDIAHAGLLHSGGATQGPRREGALVIACRHGDELAAALDNGPLSLTLDPAAPATAAGRPARVLVASCEVAGPTSNGGIGTAYHSLAHMLAKAGHDVTLLFTGWIGPERAELEPEWRAHFSESGIDFQLLGCPWDVPVRNPHHQARRAYEFHRWLQEAHAAQPFDVVHMPEALGHGAFAQTAKRLGRAYDGLEFVIGTHSSQRWVAECNREGIDDLDRLVMEHLERRSVELADVLISPTAFLLDYMHNHGWSLPQRTFVQPLVRPQAVRRLAGERHSVRAGTTDGPRRLVFFGRLETCKGLEAFCDAVDLLVEGGDVPFEHVTFLGRPERVLGESAAAYIERRGAAWSLPHEIVGGLGHAEAIAYLRSHNCVVALPSLVDNSPNTVIETIALGVPFVASRSGGIGELIAVDDLATTTFDGWGDARALEPATFSDVQDPFDVTGLAVALRAKAAAPPAAVAPAIGDDACDRAYDRWHRAIAARPHVPRELPAAQLTAAVCIVARDEVEATRVAAAVAHGTQAPAKVVAVVERGTDERPEAAAPAFELVVAAGRDGGPARRRVAAALDADVTIVLRGHEDPDPELVERVVSAMSAGGGDVLALVTRDPDADRSNGTLRHLRRDDVPRDLRAFVPLSGPALAAVAYPALSVGPYAIRSSALAALDGFASDTWGDAVDRELLSRAALADLRIDVLPEPVATTIRDDAWAETRTRYWGEAPVPSPRGEEQIRLLRPFRRLSEGPLADLPALLVGTVNAVSATAERANAAIAENAELVDVYEGRIAEFTALTDLYEGRIAEQRDLIALYERQKEEMRTALNAPRTGTDGDGDSSGPSAGRTRDRLRRATRGPASAWPARGARVARRQIEQLRRRQR